MSGIAAGGGSSCWWGGVEPSRSTCSAMHKKQRLIREKAKGNIGQMCNLWYYGRVPNYENYVLTACDGDANWAALPSASSLLIWLGGDLLLGMLNIAKTLGKRKLCFWKKLGRWMLAYLMSCHMCFCLLISFWDCFSFLSFQFVVS